MHSVEMVLFQILYFVWIAFQTSLMQKSNSVCLKKWMWREELYEANSFLSFLLQVTPESRRSRSWKRAGRTFLGWDEWLKPDPAWCTWKISQSKFWAASSCPPMSVGPRTQETSWVLLTGLPHRDGHGQISNVAPGEQKASPDHPVSTTQMFKYEFFLFWGPSYF